MVLAALYEAWRSKKEKAEAEEQEQKNKNPEEEDNNEVLLLDNDEEAPSSKKMKQRLLFGIFEIQKQDEDKEDKAVVVEELNEEFNKHNNDLGKIANDDTKVILFGLTTTVGQLKDSTSADISFAMDWLYFDWIVFKVDLCHQGSPNLKIIVSVFIVIATLTYIASVTQGSFLFQPLVTKFNLPVSPIQLSLIAVILLADLPQVIMTIVMEDLLVERCENSVLEPMPNFSAQAGANITTSASEIIMKIVPFLVVIKDVVLQIQETRTNEINNDVIVSSSKEQHHQTEKVVTNDVNDDDGNNNNKIHNNEETTEKEEEIVIIAAATSRTTTALLVDEEGLQKKDDEKVMMKDDEDENKDDEQRKEEAAWF